MKSRDVRQDDHVWVRRSVPWMLLIVLGGLTAGAAVLGMTRSPMITKSALPANRASVTFPGVAPNAGAYRIPAGTTFSVSTTHWTVGQPVTLSGSNCPREEGVTTTLASTSGDVPFTRNADGTWSVTATVPVGSWGPAQVSATCGDLNLGAPLFKYLQTYSVFISTPYALHVMPSGPLAPGSTVTVTPTTSFCSTLDTIEVGVAVVATPFSSHSGAQWLVQPVLAQIPSLASGFEVIDDVYWSAAVTIPADAHSGTYYVAAACMLQNRGYPRLYAAQTVGVVSTSAAGTATLPARDLLSPRDLPPGWKTYSAAPPLPSCYAQALHIATPLATLRTNLVHADGHLVAFEQLALFSDGSATMDAYTSMTIALAQCAETNPAQSGTGIRSRHVLREYPKIAPTFIGSEGFVDQQTRGSTKSYQALVVVRRGTTVIAVTVADHGAVDAQLVRQLVSAALHKMPQ